MCGTGTIVRLDCLFKRDIPQADVFEYATNLAQYLNNQSRLTAKLELQAYDPPAEAASEWKSDYYTGTLWMKFRDNPRPGISIYIGKDESDCYMFCVWIRYVLNP